MNLHPLVNAWILDAVGISTEKLDLPYETASYRELSQVVMAETASELRRQILLEHNEEHASTSFHGGEKSIPIEEEMEELHDGLSFGQFMVAGSVAGMVEHMAMFPVDTLKTRMQMLASAGGFSHSGVGKALLSIMRSEGPFGLYRGIGAMGLGAGPAHAVYFSVYEFCKEKFGGNKPGHHPLVHAGSGVTATIASDAVFTPMDVVKQRLQLRSSPYRGVMDCITRMLREEGIRAFYVSYRTTIVMNAPFTAVHFSTYEAMKKALSRLSPETASEENLFVHIMAGGVAGALASAVTTPFDVVKTRLQCQGVLGADRFTSSSIRNAVQTIVAKEGPTALLRGLKPRVLFHAPAAAICWSTYEACKSFLHNWNAKSAT